ncbi:hypothetical protein [Metallosphaera hakonensis]|uniref:Uncharacterized protein n=1 Tax=Metallosphaera hakonensis JCM 8857 = DSM 7519 TaxID=1293036 RepID=A0A2U9ITH8_9CREN|nr:hypothetical protein [Metallosphaera hakonensis]AWR99370.1 hypothetical protein DFR87_06245 [Metallosphaera hakonensis JCM 8857 = DSM 7519]
MTFQNITNFNSTSTTNSCLKIGFFCTQCSFPQSPWYVTHWPELVVLALTAVTVLASLTIPEVRYLAFKFLKRERA